MHLIALFMALLLFAPGQTQEHIPITLDEPVEVSVVALAPTTLLYEAQQDGYVTIDVRALEEGDAALDSVLWVLDAESRWLAYDDNGGVGSNARLEHLWLPAGTYTLVVDSFSGVGEGRLQVQITASSPYEAEESETEDGLQIAATLPENRVFRYEIDLRAGERLTITVRDTSGTLDPLLRLRDASGTLLASNDDHDSSDLTLNVLDARIVGWDVPAAGTYRIEVLDFLGHSGEFLLRIERGE